MFNYILHRIVFSILTIFVIVTIVTLIIYIIPGDPAYFILGDMATPETVAYVRTSLGLDRPIFIQYWDRLKGYMRLDFGNSLHSGRPIGPELADRLGRSFELVMVVMILSSFIGIPLGIWAASGTKFSDLLISFFSIIGLSSPSIVAAPIIAYLLGVRWRIFPSSGFVALEEDLIGHFTYLALPVLSLMFFAVGIITRMTRSCVLDKIRKDYVRTAHAKGLTKTQVLFKHVLKNSLVPVVTLIGMRIGLMIAGAFITETIFNWPGINQYLVYASYRRDYTVIQAVILTVAVIFVFLNLIVDLLLGVVDPRIQYS